MGYRVFLLDGIEYVELDTENVDITTIFSVSDINDIATRKDNITKQVAFKGTKTNNYAFGSLFHLNKTSSSSVANKLFFNYNPLRTVDCLVYEDSMVVFKGSMRVLEVTVSRNQEIIYQTVITGKFTEFKNIIQDKLLTDLDFSDLKHLYTYDAISTSWIATKGAGYVYPHIDYGHLFEQATANLDKSKYPVLNYRPALYVKEYLKKIFSQPELNGFSYEVKGSPEFIERFNALVIPDSQQNMVYTLNGYLTKFEKSPFTTINETGFYQDGSFRSKLIPLSIYTAPPTDVIKPYVTFYSTYTNVFMVNRTVTTDAVITIKFSHLTNTDTQRNNEFWIDLMERDEENNANPISNWNIIGQIKWDFTPGQSFANRTATLNIGERQWKERKQLAIRLVTREQGSGHSYVTYNVTSAEFCMPKNNTTLLKADLRFSTSSADADYITPKAPENIKQTDFLKGLINLFNMYVYTETTNPKHVIFESYDDYYALTSPALIKATAIDWTNKVDLSNGFKIKSNLSIPKSYQFTFKEDNGYVNSDYKKKYGEVYGTFKFSDSLGVTAEKKVELIFSPSPIIQEVGNTKYFLSLYAIENQNKKLQKSNIRILYYNGLTPCNSYTIAKDTYSSGWTITDIQTLTSYPMTTNYYYDNTGKPIEDIHFGRPKEWYFPATVEYVNTSSSYANYYTGQVSELTNPNLFVIECDCVLDELDIANLDLKTPVFIDLGELGHSYFKVLSIEYISNSHTSKVVLQKIVLGTDR